MFQSLDVDERDYAHLTLCSWERGWRSLLLRRRTYRPETEPVSMPVVAEQGIQLVLRGESSVESEAAAGRRAIHSGPGRIGLMAPARPVRLRWRALTPEPLESLSLHLPAGTTDRLAEELWDREPSRAHFPHALTAADPMLEHILRGLLRAAEDGLPDLYAESAAELVAVHILARHTRLTPPADRVTDQRIRRARAAIRERLHLPLSLAEMAAEAGLSRYHFLRLFRAQTGETPHRYVTRLRIERARDALTRTVAPVSLIAAESGFASPSHLATAFRRETGSSPSAYRALHRDRRHRLEPTVTAEPAGPPTP